MREHEHTLGPWEIGIYNAGRVQIIAKQGPIEVSPAMANSIPDAHLIAAAPDMLKELRRIIEFAKDEKAPLQLPEINSIARVIAKAEGRS